MIKYILLGFLNYQPMTGYELKQTIDQSTAHFWHAYHSQIYTSLRQMEAEGLVTSEMKREEGRPEQRIYTITPAGQQALKAWLDQTMTEASPIKEELLVRLFFSAQRDAQQVLTELRLQRELHQDKLAAYQAIAENTAASTVESHPALKRDQEFWRLTLELGLRYEETYIGWLRDAIHTIEAL
jgi:PadR family transcriptional regulator, phenolic acid-responsive transcriptional regulator